VDEVFGDLQISYTKTESNRGVDGITIRHFTLKKQDDPKEQKVIHIQYTEWPDFGVPPSTKTMQRLLTEVDIRKKGLSGAKQYS
jgi:protein tyrosine phosphatase